MISQERTIGQDWLYRKKKMMMMTELVGEAFLSGREMGGFILGPAPIHAMGSLQCDDADMTALAHKPSRQSAPRKLATPTLIFCYIKHLQRSNCAEKAFYFLTA